jgi:protein TonB
MFKVLTGEKKRRAITPATITASVAVHLLLLGGLVYASTGDKGPIEVVGPEVVLPPLQTEPTEPPPPPEQPTVPQPAAEQPDTKPIPGEVLQVEEVTEVPQGIKEELPGVRPVDPKDYDGDGQLGTVIGPPVGPPAGPVGPPTPPAVEPGPYTVDLVEVRPVLDRNGLSRTLERHYPPVLRQSRVSGRVVIELVVDEEGLPVPGSARVIEASHPAFGEAALRAVDRFRFSPAKIGGTPVPVVVTIPIQWTVPN